MTEEDCDSVDNWEEDFNYIAAWGDIIDSTHPQIRWQWNGWQFNTHDADGFEIASIAPDVANRIQVWAVSVWNEAISDYEFVGRFLDIEDAAIHFADNFWHSPVPQESGVWLREGF